jgi:hypothetical protein
MEVSIMKARRLSLTIFSLTMTSLSLSSLAQSQSTQPNFATMKAQLTARLQKTLSCVQAAATADALRQCMPPPPDVNGGPSLPPLPPLPQN